MLFEPLGNLTEQSARVGTWMLSVATNPRSEDYTWSKGGAKGTGKKFECLLVSQDSTEYCLGLFRKRRKEPAATNDFNAALSRFEECSIL